MTDQNALDHDTDSDEVARTPLLAALMGYHLRRASAVFANGFAQSAGRRGMRQVLFGVLAVVRDNPGIKQGAAGKVLGIQRANMVSLVNELVDRGLLARRVADSDRRAFSLELTASGEVVVEDVLTRIEANERALLADFTDRDRETLLTLLARIEAHNVD